MKLFFISAALDRDTDTTFDLLVWADTPEEAVRDWTNHWTSEYDVMEAAIAHEELPARVRVAEVNTATPTKGAVDWENCPVVEIAID
jgi:hypothetical protein